MKGKPANHYELYRRRLTDLAISRAAVYFQLTLAGFRQAIEWSGLPFIFSGTIVITLVIARAGLDEPIAATQWLGCVLVLAGIALLFWKEQI